MCVAGWMARWLAGRLGGWLPAAVLAGLLAAMLGLGPECPPAANLPMLGLLRCAAVLHLLLLLIC